MAGPIGPPATISREPGQARKGATVAVTLCAGVWLVGFASIFLPRFFLQFSRFLRNGSSSAFSPLWSISCISASSRPISPLGKPLRANQPVFISST